MELDCGIGYSKCGVEMLARQAKIRSHHAIANGMAGVENFNIVGSIGCVLCDIEDLHAGPSMLQDDLKKVSQ